MYGYDKKSVDLPEYWISKTPVTNIAYKKFIDANPAHEVPKMLWLGGQNNWDKSTRTFKSELAEHPVVIVNWYEAITFCAWAGLQLPLPRHRLSIGVGSTFLPVNFRSLALTAVGVPPYHSHWHSQALTKANRHHAAIARANRSRPIVETINFEALNISNPIG